MAFEPSIHFTTFYRLEESNELYSTHSTAHISPIRQHASAMIYALRGHKTCIINKWSACIVYMVSARMLILFSAFWSFAAWIEYHDDEM